MYENIQIKKDGSYVVMKNGYPYHIPDNEEYKEEYEQLKEYAEQHPDKVAEYVEPIYQMPKEDERIVRLRKLEEESNSLSQDVLAAVATDKDKARFKAVRQEIKLLKSELAESE